jgi:hypothetical protein
MSITNHEDSANDSLHPARSSLAKRRSSLHRDGTGERHSDGERRCAAWDINGRSKLRPSGE